MEMSVYAVWDEVAKIFKYQFLRGRHAEAIRYFADSCRSDKTEMFQHPSDFSLFFLATFNMETGKFVSLDVPERISRASDFFTSSQPAEPVCGGL